jgi:hypothetical protein
MQAVAAETSTHHHSLDPIDPNFQAKVLAAFTHDRTSAILIILTTKLQKAEVRLSLSEHQLSLLGVLGRTLSLWAIAPLCRGHVSGLALCLAVRGPRCSLLVLRASQ